MSKDVQLKRYIRKMQYIVIERGENVVEYKNVFKGENGAELMIEIKTECFTHEEMKKILSFIAKSTYKFYIETADKINSML